jgi:DNA-binding SARP family transcriptional activator
MLTAVPPRESSDPGLRRSPVSAEVIRRKLAPPPRPDHLVARPRLDAALVSLLARHRVLRICATAGAGKTTTVADAARKLGTPVAWLTVDQTDAAPGRLLTYIEAALAEAFPNVKGAATRALAAGLPHREAVGLLAQTANQGPIVFVLDELERLGQSADAWAVIESLIRYAPAEMRIVLVSRRDLPLELIHLPGDAGLAALGETDLAFTEAEAASALALREIDIADVAAVVEATGGWVTGVLFDAWRSGEHVAGAGGEADPLYGYLSSHILSPLTDVQRDFLIACSLLDEVTALRAEALGLSRAGATLASLRAAHLPVSWSGGWQAMRCSSRFREYLLDQLMQRSGTELAELRRRHGQLLAGEGHWEEATDELITAGDLDGALSTAERAVFGVIERLDFAVAERWLAILAEVPRDGPTQLTVAELLIALAQDDYRRAARTADELATRGQRDQLAGASSLAAALMGWCYLHVARLDDLSAVLAAARPGPEVDAVRYCAALIIDLKETSGPESPVPTGGPLDALSFSGSYFLGHLNDLMQPPASPFVEALSRPYRIGALRAAGQTQQALALYEATLGANPGQVALHAAIGPEVLIDAGRLSAAREAVERGRKLALASGSLGFRAINVTAAMKLALRLERNPAAARAALEELELDSAVRRFHFTAEQQDVWYGFALLLDGEDAAALARLRRAVTAMQGGGRLLELPTAAVYLAEAEWRTGDEDAADRMADLALATARAHGSNHLLLQALADFPAVASRRIDAEPSAESSWHELGRALIGQGVALHAVRGGRIRLQDFGVAAIFVDEVEVRPGLAKSTELLAYLCLHRGETTERERLLGALFDGRADDSARAYVRQAIGRLRAALPEGSLVSAPRGGLVFADEVRVSCVSLQFEADIAEASRLQDEARLTATLKALSAYDRGPYLAAVDSPWVDERRGQLARIATDARYAVAELAYSAGRLGEARRLVEATVREDRYREGAWRLMMRIAGALGDEAGVLSAFQGCERALAGLSTRPSATTTRLLQDLRR